jgi:hypothetical protein
VETTMAILVDEQARDQIARRKAAGRDATISRP